MLRTTWLTLVLAVLTYSPSSARPPHKKALVDHFGPFLANKLSDCRTCHLAEQSNKSNDALAAEEKPHNPFGARLKALRAELRKTGKTTDIPARLEAAAEEDSDGDGVPNLIEILTGHYPGDASDKPEQTEVAGSRRTLAEFRKSQSTYPWRPFEVVKRPAVPPLKNPNWIRNPIDAFIAAEHEARGLKPRPEADKPTLLRRVYLDLIGLPPTPDELHAFLLDNAPNAYEKVVDKLLASPRYGERWGRHWMDIWRYSDWAGWTDGGQIRDSQPHIWRWRDWIIESLNADKGYDRMILEMFAADELCPEDTNVLRGSGYLARNYKMLSREKWMQDVVDHTFMGFQAVTIGCARCHDHMYDPIRQKEYYQLRAIFEPHEVRIDRVPGELDTKKDGLARAFDAKPEAKTVVFIRGDDRNPDKDPVAPGVPELLGGNFPKIEPVKLPQEVYAPDKRSFVVEATLAESKENISKAQKGLQAAKEKSLPALLALNEATARASRLLLNEGTQKVVPELTKGWEEAQKALDALSLAELDAPIAEIKHAALVASINAEKLEDAGKKDSEDWKKIATEAATLQRKLAVLEAKRNLLVAKQTLRVAAEKTRADAAKKVTDNEKALAKAEADDKQPVTTAYTKRAVTVYSATSTGRRLAFARWLADKENPLTARVAVNHIWLRHFGQAIVPSVFDFGRNGRPPSHPALLDWLAAEFMEASGGPASGGRQVPGWSMKRLHRLIVTSSTYRMSSTPDAGNVTIDRDNKYLWRMLPRRVEAEVVRDCVLYVAGKLDLTMSGPEIDYKQGLSTPRRSLYFRHAAEKQMEFLKLFDAASVTECYQRKESVLPQQALALANSELTIKNSRLLARMLVGRVGSEPTAFTTAAFEQVLSRAPTSAETAECVAFLSQQLERFKNVKLSSGSNDDGNTPASDPALRARENLVHVLMNHHDFVTIR